MNIGIADVWQESQSLWIAARCLDKSSIKTSWASLPAKQAITVGFSSGFNVKLLHDWTYFDLQSLCKHWSVEHICLTPASCLSLTKGLFALREILFVLQKNLSTRNHFKCERFFSSTKILSSVTKLQRDRRVALEAYNFLSSEKIYCSVTATLQRVIIFRNRYHTKWYCVRDPIYRHLPPFTAI